jgi:hypothetical protein
LRGINYKTMDRNLIQQVEENEEEEKEENVTGVPVCGRNLSTPVFDIANYIEQVHYKIGTRLYIENAD